jgi:hypothetical protein
MVTVLQVFTNSQLPSREKPLTKPTLRTFKPLLLLLIICIPTITILSNIRTAKADVTLISITPSEGYVGTTVEVTANTTVENAAYNILFDTTLVATANADGNNINSTFQIPPATSGTHTIIVREAQTGSEADGTFTVLTQYSIETNMPTAPNQLQENSTVGISLSITGGQASFPYLANVTVTTPANTTFWMNLSLTAMPTVGYYNATTNYPTTTWTPSTANTNYTGTYTITWLDGTEIKTTSTFFIGITNQTSYHRQDSIGIKALDYTPNDNVTITITGISITYTPTPFNATVDSDGVVYANWTVPSDAPRQTYKLSITPVPTSKTNANDTQTFDVPGLNVTVNTRNLANNTVPNVFLKTRDDITNVNYTTVSDENGTARFLLERGNFTSQAFFQDVKVGETTLIVTQESSFNFTLNLTTAIIHVIDAQNNDVPFISITLSYNYTTNLDTPQNQTATQSGQTNITGLLQIDSLLTNITYTLNASRYDQVFNQNNNTIQNMPQTDYEPITILLPTETLHVTVIDSKDNPLQAATVTAIEQTGGNSPTVTTNSNGAADLTLPFGRYTVSVYKDNILLNETSLGMFSEQNATIDCQLYGLSISVSIVDYFGQPIPNANVILERQGLTPLSGKTQSNGAVTFENVIGGEMHVTVYMAGQSQPVVAEDAIVGSSETISIKIEKYVVLAGFLIETSQLATIILVVVTVLILLSVEVYRRRHRKPKKEENTEQE